MEDTQTARNYDSLYLENQLCFPLYACAKEVVLLYRKPLEPLSLTYTQYVVMMVLWEYGGMTESELGQKVHLDSGTLAPLLKRLDRQGYVRRSRPLDDERALFVSLTEEGENLKKTALSVPCAMTDCLRLQPHELIQLKGLLDKALRNMAQAPGPIL